MAGEIIMYRTPDGQTRIECRLLAGTVWLSQALIAGLFGKDVRTVSEHVSNIFDDNELQPQATVRKFRIVQREGATGVSLDVAMKRLCEVRCGSQESEVLP